MKNRTRKNGSTLPGSFLFSAQLAGKYGYYLFRSFSDSSVNLCWISDKHQNLVYANISLLNFFDLNLDAVGKNLIDILPEDLAGFLRDKFNLEWKHGLFKTSTIKTVNVSGEEKVFSIRIFKLSDIGEAELYGGIACDISEHYELEKKLFECNEKWLGFTHNVFQGIWEWEVKTGKLMCSEPLMKMLDLPPDRTLTLEDWLSQVHEDDAAAVKANFQQLLTGEKEIWEEEYRVKTKENVMKTFLDRGLVIQQQDKPYKLVGSVLDVTEVKNLEHELARERKLKEQELAQSILQVQERERTHIGHELHDNIGQLLTTAQLLLDLFEATTNNQKELKEKCTNVIGQALEEIRSLSKELALPELKANGLHLAILDLVDEIQMASSLQINYSNDVDDIESLDGFKKIALFRILQEQLKNIIKHAKAKTVDISIKDRHGLLELEIKDDGIGFDTHRVRRGVGFSSIFERTKVSNGNMKIESSPGAGTRLLVVFPWDQING